MIRIAAIFTLLCSLVLARSQLPRADSPGFTVQSSIIIDAPIERVWQILVDFPSYPQWNPFVRSQTVLDSWGAKTADQVPKENLRLFIQVQIPPLPLPVDENTPADPLHSQTSYENITILDTTNYRTAWRQLMIPKDSLDAERFQSLSVTDGEKTLYEAKEVFGGPLSTIVNDLYGQGLQEGFDAQAVALKARAEQTNV